MKCRGVVFLVAGLLPLNVSSAQAGTIKIGRFSDQATPRRAVIGAHIDATQTQAAIRDRTRHVSQPSSGQTAIATVREGGGATPAMPPRFPPIAASAAVLRNPQPAGPQSFWYTDGGGHQCMYAPNSVLPCFTVVGPGATAAGGLNPAAVAASVADRAVLVPGRVEASPSTGGLTGADSWLWLDPSPQRRELSVTLAGESVTVTADPSVEWRFGDGSSLDGGPGVPYQPGPAPAGAVEHVYQTRCLPGDQGRDPYVLASCGDNGYSVEALVVWQISYQAAGTVATSGTLPTRTTASSSVYPVSEARAFLVPAGGAP